MPGPNHPLWPILHIAVVGGVLTAVLHFGYAGGWDHRDLLPVLSAGGLMAVRELRQRQKNQLCPRCRTASDETES